MALNGSGTISMGGSTAGQSINLELGRSATSLINLNETDVRSLAGISSGAISLSNFWGKSLTQPINYSYNLPASNNLNTQFNGSQPFKWRIMSANPNFNIAGGFNQIFSGSNSLLGASITISLLNDMHVVWYRRGFSIYFNGVLHKTLNVPNYSLDTDEGYMYLFKTDMPNNVVITAVINNTIGYEE